MTKLLEPSSAVAKSVHEQKPEPETNAGIPVWDTGVLTSRLAACSLAQ